MVTLVLLFFVSCLEHMDQIYYTPNLLPKVTRVWLG